MNNTDPRSIINNEPMGGFQVIAIAICVLLNALDGFDVLAITFAAPGIAKEWALDPRALGIVISTGLVGMVLGSLLLAPLADVVGRRLVIIVCLVAMTIGMLLSATADGVYWLAAWRVVTGLGMGGMLAALTAMVAECSNDRHRNLGISLMTVGYPLGGVLGGLAAVWLLKHFDWRSVFIFGGVTSGVFLPLVLWRLPESIEFLTMKRGPNALQQINGILQRMGRSTAVQLPPPQVQARRPLLDIFKPELLPRTLVVSGAYFLHILTFYYVLGWIPAIVGGLGFPASSAASVSVWANLGGIASGAVLGYAARYVGLKTLSALAMLTTAVMLVFFGRAPADLETLRLLACILGFFMFGGVVCLYANFARVFPTHVRATGTGFAIGFGRIGGVLGPVIGGWLMVVGLDRANVALVMGLGSVLAAVAILTLPSQPVASTAPVIQNKPVKAS